MITPKYPHFLHGGDYNPDQWLDRPDILERDIELMQAAKVNCVSVGIFAWTRLEPEDGVYDFDWLDRVIDRLWQGGIRVSLATPSGAKPAWMAQRYPEVLRVNEHFQRMHWGDRHNHCPTSPVYRGKVREMNTRLAQRYGQHPAVILWHLSNEYGGECRCPLCQEAFRGWLKERYGSLEELNRRWWTGFWSQRYTDWAQIEAPSPDGESANSSMWVDWRRFVTHQVRTFIENERDAVKAVCPGLPVTINMMERYWDYDYYELAEAIDFVSWDSYPRWHSGDDVRTAANTAMNHDLMRSFKDQPFVLMESTPSQVNWTPVNKLKRPGMHLLSSLQAVAHGSQSVMYFQWRKSRGAAEMFHGAVVDHDNRGDTRVFRDVQAVGEALGRLEPLYGLPLRRPQVCVIYDAQNRWAVDYAQTGQKGRMQYFDTVLDHYQALWRQGIAVDFRDMREVTDLSPYRLVVAPMLFMYRNGFGEKLRRYVEAGGTLLQTYFSGVVDDSDLAFMGGAPGQGMAEALGLRATELDALYPEDHNAMVFPDGQRWAIRDLAEIPVTEGAEALAVYGEDFYAGVPCYTRHACGQGEARYLAAKVEQAGLNALYAALARELGLERALDTELPEGVIATRRADTVFLQNYSASPQTVVLPAPMTDRLTGERFAGSVTLAPCGIVCLTEG